MTFLELCQRLRQEVGAAGNGPTNVTGQTGEYARLAGWIQQAWLEIQLERLDWRFQWAQGQVEVTPDFINYSLPADFRKWRPDTLKINGDQLRVAEWDDYRDTYPEPTAYPPGVVTISPDRVMWLNGYPPKTCNVTFEYWRTPQPLTTNTDVPRLPERYHMALVYRAMIQYALYENAPEVVEQARRNDMQMMQRLVNDQIPDVTLGASLA